MCLFLCIFFHSKIKVLSEKFLQNVPSTRVSAHDDDVEEKSAFAVCMNEMALLNRHIRGEYMCAVTNTYTPTRARQQQQAKAEGKGKEKQHKMLYTIFDVDCSRNIRLCTFATLKKRFL